MGNDNRRRPERNNREHFKPRTDETATKMINQAENHFLESMDAFVMHGLNGFQRKCVHEHFERSHEYHVKSFRENDDVILKVYPVGKIRRLAEQKAQEVLMNGTAASLPVMGSFERFIIHDYLKERDGIRTESSGEPGKDRHVEIHPQFGRTLKKAKHKLM